MKYVVLQDCPIPAKLAPIVRKILAESGAHLQSAYRGADATKLLHKCGKKSQVELYEGFLHHEPGFNPANPPGYSTHELRSDGVAYGQFKRGQRIPWWGCGLDIDDAHVKSFIAVAHKHGWPVWRPYPAGSEYHHVNFRKPPLLRRIKHLMGHAVRTFLKD